MESKKSIKFKKRERNIDNSGRKYNGQRMRILEKNVRENGALVINDKIIITENFSKLKKISSHIFKKHEPQEGLSKNHI